MDSEISALKVKDCKIRLWCDGGAEEICKIPLQSKEAKYVLVCPFKGVLSVIPW